MEEIKPKVAGAMLARRMSPMEMTKAMVGGVAKHELAPPVTPGAGGWREQPTKTRSKAEREKRRKAKAARRKNR